MRGATEVNEIHISYSRISIHAPRAGCDCAHCRGGSPGAEFQSTHPVRGATVLLRGAGKKGRYFNPRTPCGVRPREARMPGETKHFNPRTPCGVRHRTFWELYYELHFNPRTPCGVRRRAGNRGRRPRLISIHAPRAGCDGKFDGFTRPNLRKRYKKVSVQPKKRAKKKIKEMLCSHSHIFGWISGAKVPEFPAR